MKGIGIASFFIVTAVTLFYTTIIGMIRQKKILLLFLFFENKFNLAHAVFYLFSSFREIMPWSLCTHIWNTNLCSERMRGENLTNQTYISLNQTERTSSADEYYNIYMLGINHSKGLTDLGYIKVDVLLCLISIFILMYMCIYRGVKSTGKLKIIFPF